MPTIDLNCDLGESFGAYTIGADEAVMGSITSANVACGYHGGDPGVMRRTVRLAREAGVAVGAHPGFPDLVGFGRREMRMTPQDVEDMVLYQIGALAGIAQSEGVRLSHVKAHGALYNMAVKDAAVAAAIAGAVAAFDPGLILLCAPRVRACARRDSSRTPGRSRRICRSRIRARWFPDPPLTCGSRHRGRR